MTDAFQVLQAAGVTIKGGNLTTVELMDRHRQMLRVLEWETTSAASLFNRRPELEQNSSAHTLFIVPSAPQHDLLTTVALELELNLVVLNPPQVFLDGNSVGPDRAGESTEPRPRRRGPNAVGRWAVERSLLLADGPRTQRELAADTGISQQAVSHALRQTRSHAVVASTSRGFVVPSEHRAELLEGWLADYPGPLGVETFWYGLDSPIEQGQQIATYAAEMNVDVAMSGDVAVDVYQPWRHPVRGIAYLTELLDLAAVDLVPATREDATFIAVVPRDQTVWATARSCGAPGLVDPVIALWDFSRAGGTDADQAAARLRTAIVEHDLR